jgi:hypothetical protein
VANKYLAEPLQSVHDTIAMLWVFNIARFLFLWGKREQLLTAESPCLTSIVSFPLLRFVLCPSTHHG